MASFSQNILDSGRTWLVMRSPRTSLFCGASKLFSSDRGFCGTTRLLICCEPGVEQQALQTWIHSQRFRGLCGMGFFTKVISFWVKLARFSGEATAGLNPQTARMSNSSPIMCPASRAFFGCQRHGLCSLCQRRVLSASRRSNPPESQEGGRGGADHTGRLPPSPARPTQTCKLD